MDVLGLEPAMRREVRCFRRYDRKTFIFHSK